ncbi:rhodanese-like domain-containing protein [Nocardioides panaciterrulae]|uniref:Rhodanese-related sulfurtransferase n=1 Tax=Nocardioides panaciterrulae TaxID=661492 RepID=A0A7Y9E9U9_9ACTN|nr:rhodanese-like domain-containing protein [Nocardioides panaciterrulae]NYD43856.1 rhodanese-related sulfurtransferase [Nocardioides panaciterrulae]
MHQIPTVSVDGVPDPLPPGLVVLDVREPVEWEHGHIDGALHIPLMQLPQRFSELPEGQALVVCKIGGRSAQAVGYLVQQGIDAVNLDGGMIGWAEAGRAMVSETGQRPHVV